MVTRSQPTIRRLMATAILLLLGLALTGTAVYAGLSVSPALPQVSAQVSHPLLTETASPTPCPPSWMVVDSPHPGVYNPIEGMAAISSNDVWAVGRYLLNGTDNTLTEHWDGTAWDVVSSPNVGSVNWLSAVVAISPNDVWAVGGYSLNGTDNTLTEHWDGIAWSVVASPSMGMYDELSGVAAAGSNDMWAVGEFATADSVYHPITMHWDGTAWSLVNNPIPDGSHLYGVAAISSNDVWAVGFSANGALTQHWDGTAWAVVSSPNPGVQDYFNAVAAVGSNDVWAVGVGRLNGVLRALIEHWDGSVWTVVNSPNLGSGTYLHGVAAAGPADVWAVGDYSPGSNMRLALTEHWDGNAWSVVSSPSPNGFTYLYPVSMVGPGDVWAAGFYTTANGLDTIGLVEHYSTACATPTPTSSPTMQPATPAATATSTACPIQFTDVPSTNTFYPYVRCMACRGIVSGYPCGGVNPQTGEAEPCDAQHNPYFRYNNAITRGQISKLVSNAAGFSDDPGPQIFEDVSPASPFFPFINRLSNRGVIGGYPCGTTPSEPCIAPSNRSYFRPSGNASRGQISKIVELASGATQIRAPAPPQFFEDVLPGSPFYIYVEELYARGAIGGYPCGGRNPQTGQAEPCVACTVRISICAANSARATTSVAIVSQERADTEVRTYACLGGPLGG